MSESITDLHALGVPRKMIARQFGLSEGQVYRRLLKSEAFAHDRELRAKASLMLARTERVKRIKANVALAPSRSLFAWPDETRAA